MLKPRNANWYAYIRREYGDWLREIYNTPAEDTWTMETRAMAYALLLLAEENEFYGTAEDLANALRASVKEQQPDIFEQVATLLTREYGYKAYREHPGFVRVEDTPRHEYNFGTANGPWGYDDVYWTDASAETACGDWNDLPADASAALVAQRIAEFIVSQN